MITPLCYNQSTTANGTPIGVLSAYPNAFITPLGFQHSTLVQPTNGNLLTLFRLQHPKAQHSPSQVLPLFLLGLLHPTLGHRVLSSAADCLPSLKEFQKENFKKKKKEGKEEKEYRLCTSNVVENAKLFKRSCTNFHSIQWVR